MNSSIRERVATMKNVHNIPVPLMGEQDDLYVYQHDTNENISLYIREHETNVHQRNIVENLFVTITRYCDRYSCILFNELTIGSLYTFLFGTDFQDDLEPQLNLV